MSDVWSELPYVISTGFWWVIFPLVLIATPWIYFAMIHKAFDWGRKDFLVCVSAGLITFLVIVCYIAAIVSYDANHPYDGHHEWRDGSGPNTACHYETRNELEGVIGKGGHYEDHIYTVCLDVTGR